MTLSRLWAGKVYGTNTGNLFLQLEGQDDALTGTLRVNEPGVGLFVYSITGTFDGTQIKFTGTPETHIQDVVFGNLTATAILKSNGNLEGEWETTIGAAGTFVLYPHNHLRTDELTEQSPEQLHTARHRLGAIEIDREKIISVGHAMQRDLPRGIVVVTVKSGTEQTRYLQDFEKLAFTSQRAELVKLVAQEPEVGNIRRIASVEFGPNSNEIMTQGVDEAWVLGELERLKREINSIERSYATNLKRFGFGINQLLVLGAIVFLPSLQTLLDRTFLMLGVLALTIGVNRIHTRYLPHAAIYLDKKPQGIFSILAPTVISWLVAVTASVVAILLAGYLSGWLLPPALG